MQIDINELKQKPSNVLTKILKKDKNLYNKLKEKYYWVESPKELSYCIRYDIDEFPKCPYCENKCIFFGKSIGYRKTCKNEECKLKQRKQTNLERYGTKYTFQSEVIKEKIKKTWLEKYGVDNPAKSKEIQEKQIKSYKDNKIKKYQLKYNHIYFSITNYYNEKLDMIDASKICEDFNISYFEIYKIWKYFNIEIPYYFSNGGSSKYEREIIEYIKSFYNGEIQTNVRKIISPYELDIYIPEYNFAIEFDGLYFHSFGKNNIENIDKYYHLEKTEACEEKGIHLFHIWENEWTNHIKKDIWKSKIAIKMKASFINKINARDCIIKEVTLKEIKNFLEENHLQGYIPSKYKIGLYYNNELVSVMTFGKSRFKKDEFELYRFASKKYTIVRGAFSKLLKYFKEKYNINKIVSYGNRRWTFSKNNVYEKLMKKESISGPNYFYIKNNVLFPRQMFQKHKLKNILEKFDENKTELENVLNNDYNIIFDCGNIKYIC